MLKPVKSATTSPPPLAAFARLAVVPARASAEPPTKAWVAKAGVETHSDLIVVCLIGALGLLVTGLFSALGLGPEISWAIAAG